MGVSAYAELVTSRGSSTTDLHVCFYDGKTVRDNGKYTKVKILEESDRSVQGARLVFDSLFHGLEVRIIH